MVEQTLSLGDKVRDVCKVLRPSELDDARDGTVTYWPTEPGELAEIEMDNGEVRRMPVASAVVVFVKRTP